MIAGKSTTPVAVHTLATTAEAQAQAPVSIHLPSGLADHELRDINRVLNSWTEEDLAGREDTRHAVMTSILAGEKEIRVVFAGTVPTFPQYRIHLTVNDSRWTPTALSDKIPHALMLEAAEVQARGIEQMASARNGAATGERLLKAINGNLLLSANAQNLMMAELILATTRAVSRITSDDENTLASGLHAAVARLQVMQTATPEEANRKQELIQALRLEQQALKFKRADLNG